MQRRKPNGVSALHAPKWKRRLSSELRVLKDLESLPEPDQVAIFRRHGGVSNNHDTVVSLDWPHQCHFATSACGGARGFCYTLQGHHVTAAHARRVAVNDLVARRLPKVFAELVAESVHELVRRGELPYPNLRYSGSGELTLEHIPALLKIRDMGVHLWGFTRNPNLAAHLTNHRIAAIFSSDRTTPQPLLRRARALGLRIAYSSSGVSDAPPSGTLVTFPVHIAGTVVEAVDAPSLCPKVVEEFLSGARASSWCQLRCRRCHLSTGSTC